MRQTLPFVALARVTKGKVRRMGDECTLIEKRDKFKYVSLFLSRKSTFVANF
jgi:hypothetical protein